MPVPPHLPNFDCFVSVEEEQQHPNHERTVDISELEWMNEFNTINTERNSSGFDYSVRFLLDYYRHRTLRLLRPFTIFPPRRYASHFDRIRVYDIPGYIEFSHSAFLFPFINPSSKGSLAAYLQCDDSFRFRFPVLPTSVIQENNKRAGQLLRRLHARRFRFGA
jgi:hypothetical protein